MFYLVQLGIVDQLVLIELRYVSQRLCVQDSYEQRHDVCAGTGLGVIKVTSDHSSKKRRIYTKLEPGFCDCRHVPVVPPSGINPNCLEATSGFTGLTQLERLCNSHSEFHLKICISMRR